jgi:radical SAM superfamily enzyme YgiQ (UPF0313 family)
LRIYFIKPSKYDDDGSVLRFRWGVIPNNTLTVLAGLNAAYAEQRPDVHVQTVLWDELVDGVVSPAVMTSIRDRGCAAGVEVIIGLAGVQSNQYPRARDLALQFIRLGLPVIMGGFHVSSHAPSRNFLVTHGITVVVGEAETTWPVLLDDYLRGGLRSCYEVTNGLRAKTGGADILVPELAPAPLPVIDQRYAGRFFNPTFSTLDTSRGCPFVCSYCSVKNVMGRTMRARDPQRVVAWVRDAYDRHGIRNLLIVDDDLFRSPQWEATLLGIAALRRSRPDLALVIQVDIEAAADARGAPDAPDTLRQRRSRRFVELAAAAGCFEVFMGFESFSPANLEHTRKFHNAEAEDRRRADVDASVLRKRVVARYRRVVDTWHTAGVGVHCGYIIGLPFDRPGCGTEAARTLSTIGVDIASFFAYTPLPGTEDHARAEAEGSIINHDFNGYDSTRYVWTHPAMSPAELAAEYRAAYRTFYSWRRLAWSLGTFHRITGLNHAARAGMLTQQLYFTYATRRGWHPMIGGIWRVREPVGQREVRWDHEAAERYLGLPADASTPTL